MHAITPPPPSQAIIPIDGKYIEEYIILNILLCSQFIYKLTHLDAISADEETVHEWLGAIDA